MNDNDLGLWLQAAGGLCWLVAGLVGTLAPGFPDPYDKFFAVAWLIATSVFLARAGQRESN